MLYRAAGNDTEHVIRLGLAISKDGFHLNVSPTSRRSAPAKTVPIPVAWKTPVSLNMVRNFILLMLIAHTLPDNIGRSDTMQFCFRNVAKMPH